MSFVDLLDLLMVVLAIVLVLLCIVLLFFVQRFWRPQRRGRVVSRHNRVQKTAEQEHTTSDYKESS